MTVITTPFGRHSTASVDAWGDRNLQLNSSQILRLNTPQVSVKTQRIWK